MKSILLMFFLFSLLLINMSQYEAKAVVKREVAAVNLKSVLDNQLQDIYEMRNEYRRSPKKTIKFDLTPRANELLSRKLKAKNKV